MPIDNITVSSTSAQGSMLKNAQSQLQSAINNLAQALAYMQQQTDGTTYTAIETQFGLPTGKGQTVNNLVANLVGTGGSLTVTNVTQFLALLN
jgi:hypothetical protein